jgi:hypothetical protein
VAQVRSDLRKHSITGESRDYRESDLDIFSRQAHSVIGDGLMPFSRPLVFRGVIAIPFTGEPLIRRKCIEPVHYKGGFRLPRLTGCKP